MSEHHGPEPMPKGTGKKVIGEVIRDLELRDEMGQKKYGTSLRTNNGRDALVDLYQELLDGCMYLKQKLMENSENDTLEMIEELNRRGYVIHPENKIEEK